VRKKDVNTSPGKIQELLEKAHSKLADGNDVRSGHGITEASIHQMTLLGVKR
jgi:hypothetical protein